MRLPENPSSLIGKKVYYVLGETVTESKVKNVAVTTLYTSYSTEVYAYAQLEGGYFPLEQELGDLWLTKHRAEKELKKCIH